MKSKFNFRLQQGNEVCLVISSSNGQKQFPNSFAALPPLNAERRGFSLQSCENNYVYTGEPSSAPVAPWSSALLRRR